MKLFSNILLWTLSIIITLLSIMILGMGGKLQFVLMLTIAIIIFPPFVKYLKSKNVKINWWKQLITCIVLYCMIMVSFILNPAESIYKSDKYKTALDKIYDEKLAQWPTSHESRYVETEYGKIHVIISGPEDGYPIMLINASSIAGWSWMFNVSELNKKYRTYCIDNIGEPGKDIMKSRDLIPTTGPEIAEFYTEISHKLGFEKSYVVGASIGGFISTNYAMYAPERVEKLVCLDQWVMDQLTAQLLP